MKIFFKRMISLVMAFCILAGLLPALAFSANAADLEDPGLAGKTISTHSHSASTCAGVSNNTSDNLANPYAGKTIACIGDSITYGVGVTRDETDYVTLLAESLEMDYIRLGASGTTLCTGGHATCNIGKLTESNLAGADVVTILMGINDFVQAKQGYYSLGTMDSADTSTVYGAVHMWCKRIVELRQTDSLKDTEFYFMTPVITSWNNSVSSVRNWDQSKENVHGYTLRDLCNAIIEVCALYDIPVIDLNLVSGLYYNSAEDNTVTEFGGDGAHPGTVGHQMMAEAIENRLLQKHLRNDHDHSYGSWITTRYPDCDAGEQQRVCSVCTATEKQKLDGTGHSYENGICTICGGEDPEAAEPMKLRYDDHLDLTGKTVDILDSGKPTSYQVGYGVAENSVPDTAVVTLRGNTLVATGIGTASVRIDGVLYGITVEAAPISLLLLIGQSNMQGSEGNADQSIVCPEGMVYSTYGDRYTMTTENATNFVPSALTGEGSALNVNGTTTNLEDWPVYLLNEAGTGKAGPDSGYAYEWVKQTGEKVWIVNAAHGGTSISVWQKGTTQYEECLALFSACQETLRKEITAGHFTLSHTGYFWCQGCADETKTAEWYVNKFLSMHESLNQDLSLDIDGDGEVDPLEFANITVTLAGHVNKTGYRYDDGLYDATDSTFFMTYEELEMRGQRVAQYWLAGNPDYPEINMVCNIGDSWVTMPDGTDGVAEHFAAHYKNGIVDYTTQVQQTSSWYKPATASAVKDSIHYNQIGYNEVGREAAHNTLILLGEVSDSAEETTVRFVDWTGYREVSAINASTAGNSGTLVVPIVYPCYRSKSVTYQVSEGLNYLYYDLLADSEETTGTLTTIGASGSVDVELGHYWSAWETVCEPSVDGTGMQMRVCSDCGETETKEINGVWQTLKLSEHMAAMPDEYCCATNLWTAMEHDKYFFNGTSSWNIHASGTVYSVTIPINAGDQIFATSFGAAGENGGAKNGIRFTFFDADGVAKTFAPADTYAEFIKNGGYLIAPEGAVAANIAMWTNSDDNEIYILNRDHTYENGICTACGAEHPNLASYQGKVISILGDSISTFDGYIPVADGFNREHLPRYPQDNLLTDVNETWWMQVITELDAKLGINDSWRSTEVYNYIDAEVNDTYDGTKACMASLTRIQNLGSNGTPDVILFYGGTNDITQRRTVGTFDPATASTEVDLISVKWNTVADAYVAAIMRMQYFYPNAEIVAMLPTFTYKNTDEVIEEYNAVFAAICEHYGVTYVDLRDCGITTANLPDGTHPDAEGMDFITAAALDVLLDACDVKPGEHIVHSVTHNLTGAESSLGYYKGVSNGKSFVTTITGENLTVTVTMGGVDITSSAYFDGVVNIPAVTDDIFITAEGRTKSVYEDHLQLLPEEICCGTNLWAVLESENLYYTGSGWGINATGLAHSATILINPGDQLWATSFQAGGTNGGTGNGIRITWFDETDVLKSMSPSETYTEFTANGYLTAPEGAVAVNVVMWNGSDDNELYNLNRDHCYENGICTGCGVVLGDLDSDGDVDAYDLTLLARHVGGIELVTGRAKLNADVDSDGDVDANDLTMHARYVGGIITSWDQK